MRKPVMFGAIVVTLFLLIPALAGGAFESPQISHTSGVASSTNDSPGSSDSTVFPLNGGTEMIALDPGSDATGPFWLRSHGVNGWSEWVELDGHNEDQPDGGLNEIGAKAPDALGPIWIGENNDRVEVASDPDSLASATIQEIDTDRVAGRDGPVAVGSAVRASEPGLVASVVARPAIQPRSSWADQGWAAGNAGCSDGPWYSDDLRALVVHHTVTTNTYSREEVPKLLRGIYKFHVGTRGWCDVAYNFFIDRFGTIWEGRTGGVERPVIGGHARGFNTSTAGVALLGQHQSNIRAPKVASPSAESLQAVKSLATWKLGLHGVDPNGYTWMKNRASNGVLKHEPGKYIKVPTILGHRDLGVTSCPGNRTMPSVGALRTQVAAVQVGNVPYQFPSVTGNDFGPKVFVSDSHGGIRPALSAANPVNPPGATSAPVIAMGGNSDAGYQLTSDGQLRAYGSAPAVTSRPGGFAPVDLIVRDSGKSGYVLTYDGVLHAFGGTVRDRSAPGYAVAGDVDDSATGYVVDSAGGLHAVGNAPARQLNSAPRGGVVDIGLRPDAVTGWVLDGTGATRGFGGVPDYPAPATMVARALVVNAHGSGGWVLDNEGRLLPFGDERPASPVSTHVGAGVAVDAVLVGYDSTGSKYKESDDGVWLDQMFRRMIGRPAAADEYEYWAKRIDFGGPPPLVSAATTSEFYLRRIVEDLYRRGLGRTPSQTESDSRLQQLRVGTTWQQMALEVYSSDENQRRGGSDTAYIQSLYWGLTGRIGDASGLQYWLDRISRGVPRSQIAQEFIGSLESRAFRVKGLFRLGTDREPDGQTVAKYMNALGSADDLVVNARILASPEYYLLSVRR